MTQSRSRDGRRISANEVWLVGASGRAAAESALRAGWQPVVFDAFADRDTAQLCPVYCVAPYPSALCELVAARADAHHRPLLIYLGGMENHPGLLSQLARYTTVLGTPPERLSLVRNPWAVADVVRRSGVEPLELREEAKPPEQGVFVWKPYKSAGGSKVRLYVPQRRRPLRRPATMTGYFQRFAYGLPYGAVFLAAGGQARCLGVTRQFCGRRPWGARRFQYCGSATVRRWPCDPDWLQQLGNLLAERFGLQGIFGVDLICRRGRAWVLEVNPRYTASCELLEASGLESLIGLHIQACLEGRLPDRIPENHYLQTSTPRFVGKAIVYARQRVRVTAGFSNHCLKRASGPLGRRRHYGDVPPSGTIIDTHSPVLTVFAVAADPRRLLRRLNRRVRTVYRYLAVGRQ